MPAENTPCCRVSFREEKVRVAVLQCMSLISPHLIIEWFGTISQAKDEKLELMIMETNRGSMAMWLGEVGSEKGVTWELIAFGNLIIWVVDCKFMFFLFLRRHWKKQWPMADNKIHFANSRRRWWEKPMTHKKASTNSLGKCYLSDFHAPIEIAVEVMALGNVIQLFM